MHPVHDIFTQVGIYTKWAEGRANPVTESPLFQYPPSPKTTIERNLNRNLALLSERHVTVCTNMSTHHPLYVLNIPFVLPHNREEALSKWNYLIGKIRDESFGTDIQTSRELVAHRIFAIIGVNRVVSISRDDDHHFKQITKALPLERGTIGFNCQLISTLWKTRFVLKGMEIDHGNAQLAFLVLEYLDTRLATRVKHALESSSNFRSHIPYTHIREWIKNAMLQAMKSVTPERFASQPIYMSTLDSDLVSLRGNGESLFSEYDALVSSKQNPSDPVNTAPRLMSTGYFARPEENQGTQLAIIMDMHTRERISRDLPLAPYFPEPNTCILVNEVALRERLTFISKSKTLDTENRRLIQNIRSVLESDLSRIVFVARYCLQTTIPERLKTSKSLSNFQTKHLGKIEILKSFRGISQTHIDVSILNNNMWIALQLQKSSAERVAFKAPFSKIFACFDPISLVSSFPKPTSRYSHKCFDFLMKAYPTFVGYLWTALCDPSTTMICMSMWGLEAQKIRPMTDEAYTGAFRGYLEQLKEGVNIAEKRLGYAHAKKVLQVAQSAGRAIFDVLEANWVR